MRGAELVVEYFRRPETRVFGGSNDLRRLISISDFFFFLLLFPFSVSDSPLLLQVLLDSSVEPLCLSYAAMYLTCRSQHKISEHRKENNDALVYIYYILGLGLVPLLICQSSWISIPTATLENSSYDDTL